MANTSAAASNGRKVNNKIKGSPVDYIFTAINTLFMVIIACVMLYPILNTLAVSFNDATDTLRGGIYLWPRIFTTYNYKVIYQTCNLGTAFFISASRTILAAALNVFFTAMVAYTLTRQKYVLRKPITLIYVITMYVGAGLIPSYMLIRNLHLLNNFMVYIIPGLVSAFDLIVVRTYMQGLPASLIESAEIDGANEFTVFIKIIFPLSAPVLATIALFCAVSQWNSWFDTFIYCSSNKKLTTLQFELMKSLSTAMNQSGSTANDVATSGEAVKNQVTPVSIRAAITIVAAVPILIVYPFLQKYFVQGMTLGSVKE